MRFDTEYANAAAAFDARVSYVDRIMESSPGNEPAFRDPRPTFGWKCHPNRAEKTIKLRMPHGDLSGVVKRWPDADYTFHVEREEIPDSYYNSSDRHVLNIYTVFTTDFTPYGREGQREYEERSWEDGTYCGRVASGEPPTIIGA